MNIRPRPFALICLAALLVSCQNLPALQTTPGKANSPTAVPGEQTAQPPTLATETAAAQNTLQPVQTRLPSAAPLTPDAPSTPTAQAALDCARAAAGSPIDLTVPDNSELEPGQAFTKTWRLLNSSSCIWSARYAAVWFSGEKFEAPSTVYLTKDVPPGDSVDISVDMVAPQQSGTYQSNWKLESPDGDLFGIGPNWNSPFWVRILVNPPPGTEEANASTPTPVPQIYASGLANLTINDGLDLDYLKLNQGKADDVVYRMDSKEQPDLAPQNGAQLALAGKSQPDLSDCQAAKLGTGAQSLVGLASGTYFCYKTNLGLPGWARIVYLNPKDSILTLEILTWSTP